jgi:hypothetical protein
VRHLCRKKELHRFQILAGLGPIGEMTICQNGGGLYLFLTTKHKDHKVFPSFSFLPLVSLVV